MLRQGRADIALGRDDDRRDATVVLDAEIFELALDTPVNYTTCTQARVDARNTLGGTAPAQVRAQLARHKARLGA